MNGSMPSRIAPRARPSPVAARTPVFGPAAAAAAAALRGELPSHYAEAWRAPYDARVAVHLHEGARVLDVGAGWRPSVAPVERPPRCWYVGLDVSARELERAPSGSYDELVRSDISAERLGALQGRFDFVISCQVLEHVKPLPPAVDNLRSYLRPGGRLLAFFSGTFSAYGLVNRVLPRRASVWLMNALLSRPPDTIFPAHYDRCWASALERVFRDWSEVGIVPRWFGAPYFAWSRPLQAVYVGYEEWARRAGRDNLAPYYLVDAVR